MRKALGVLVAATLFPAAFGLVLVLPDNADASVVSLRRVYSISNAYAKRTCKDSEAFWLRAFRCEGWGPGACLRQSLSRPNDVYCYPNFFMSSRMKDHLDCWRRVHYVYRAGVVRSVRRGSTKWKCVISRGDPT